MLLGVHLKDGAAFRATLDKVTEKFAESLESSDFGGRKLYSVKQPDVAEPMADPTDDQPNGPPPQTSTAATTDPGRSSTIFCCWPIGRVSSNRQSWRSATECLDCATSWTTN